ncbi:ABC transporter permease [Cyanobium sp. Cruz CV13-4-11]|uniref:ABC transporter permease n=1 Tax=unclassified Cyanobium TaxID=2627006 RepID=UPI0020CECB0D|nr:MULTISPECIES: ABC transporter permease [unclassified Cyanobium]MCP9902387.1 ABC transporter permease [Cyanobium sp. Cruz CV11-17]MCP9921254.1 ABC transporter permease [Cyanobium sp. Cruz CV13-4-11]
MPRSLRAEARRPRWPWLLLTPGLLWLLGLYVLPLLGLVPLSLSEPLSRFGLDTVFTGRVANYSEVLQAYGPILLRSFSFAAIATAVGLVLAYPLAFAIRFRGGRWQPLLIGLVVLPSLSSFLVRAIAWTSLLGDNGPVLGLVESLGLTDGLNGLGVLRDGRLLNTPTAVIIGLTNTLLPFLVLPLVVAMQRIDPRLLEAAADLHAGPLRRFIRVVWPLSLPGLGAGLLLSLIPAAGDVVNPRFLGGPNDRMIANAIDNLLLVQLQAPRAAALTLVLTALITVAVGLQLRGRGLEELPLP